MKKINYYALVLLQLTLSLGSAHALDVEIPTKHAKSYLVVGISGLKTGRPPEDADNIHSSEIGKNSEDSGAWRNLNTNHKKIFANAYLSHYSSNKEIKAVLDLVEDSNGECKKDVGLIMMINSWGAKISQKLALEYLKKCKTLPHLAIIIEGVSKPTPFPFEKSIYAFNCINYFQRFSTLKGGPIANCDNNEFHFKSDQADLFYAHIYTEWEGSKQGSKIIQRFLDQKLPVMFVRDQLGVDFQNGLD